MFIEIEELKIVILPKKKYVLQGLLMVGGVWVGRDFVDQIPEGKLYLDEAGSLTGESSINPNAEILGLCVFTRPEHGVIIFTMEDELFKQRTIIKDNQDILGHGATRIYLNK